MEKAKKSRKATRTTVTKRITALETDLAAENPDKTGLRLHIQELQTYQEKLVQLDENIFELMLEGSAVEAELDEEMERTAEYRGNITQAIWKAEEFLSPPQDPPISTPSNAEVQSNGSGSHSNRTYQLPKIKLKRFSGELTEWLGWWAQFEKIHDDVDLHETDKFQYLLQAMVNGSRAHALVERYPHSKENYPKVIKALKERFGKSKVLIQVYVRELLKMILNRSKDGQEKLTLSSLYDKLESQLRSLESLGVTVDQMSRFLFPMVESCIPEEVFVAWQRSPFYEKDDSSADPPMNELDYLLVFLKQEVEREEQRELAKSGFASNSEKKKFPNEKKKMLSSQSEDDGPTAAGLFNGQGSKPSCIFCLKQHESHTCNSAVKMTLQEREAKVKSMRVCHRCLKLGHFVKSCRVSVKCATCGGFHQTVMCRGRSTKESQDVPTVQSTLNCTAEVVLQTLMVRVSGAEGNHSRLIRVLIDNGSQRSYIKKKTADELGLVSDATVTFNHALFGGTEVKSQAHSLFQVSLREAFGNFKTTMKVFDNQQLCGEIPRVQKGSWMKALRQRRLWINDLSTTTSAEIEMLIGADNYGSILTGNIQRLSNGLTAVETRLGWTLMGELKKHSSMAMTVTSMHLTSASVTELWRLEAIGIHDPVEKKSRQEHELAAKKSFLESVSRDEDGRYSVGLPWINGKVNIPNNFSVAEKRLMNTTNKLVSLVKAEDYGQVFKCWEDENIISTCKNEEINSTAMCHYLPHRAVIKESRTTPIRPVFDASCKLGRSPSLNDCLEKGPNLLELIPSILLRFRIGKIGVLADIRKAFLMVKVNEEDTDFLRFLWWEDDQHTTIKTFKHNRVVFGLNCGPFLLGAVIEYHLSRVKDCHKEIALKLLKALYVDNCVTSVPSTIHYEEFRDTSTEILSEGRMDLTQWEYTNDGSPQSVTSVLGLKWDKKEDSLWCDVIPGEIAVKITKRVVLSQLQKIFDPLGFLCPAVLIPKLILQKLWSEKGGWDSEITGELKSKFEDWWSEMSEVMNKIRVPRNVTGGEDLNASHQIHTFSDASKDAYAAAVFLRVETKRGVSIQLLQAKSRVAPLKIATIPRLELLSCTIASRLTNSVKEALSMTSVPTVYWSDSTTALAWIKRNDDWGTFVGNRVKEICSITNSEQWRHVPGVMNPADLPSRGCNPKKLLELAWWEGPEWLKADPSKWPMSQGIVDEEAVIREKKVSIATMTALVREENPWWVTRHSSFIRNVRVVAFVLRFVDIIMKRSPIIEDKLTVEEIDRAERKIISLVQREAFPETANVIEGLRVKRDKEGIIRVVTKLVNLPDNCGFRQPALLPTSHPLVDRLIREEHIKNSHAGTQIMMGNLREKYWIVHNRRAIKKIVKSCVVCRRYSVRSPTVPAAPLPEGRVSTGKAFETTGVDLAGPLTLKNKSKCWIVLFTCAVYRCVHLELVQSLSTEDFLMALVRFCKRKRRPTTIYSDNGTNFVGSANMFKSIDWDAVQRRTQQQRIQWRFNPPAAPWWGGWWERLIRSVKDLLKRMLGFGKLTHVQLETCLCVVESCMNNRPLTFVTEDQDDLIPLTPAMFINNLPEEECPESKLLKFDQLQSKFRNMEALSEELRSRFRKEYLAQLVQWGKERKHESFNVGDIVLVEMENSKRVKWPMARILELIPGKDGHVRVARVKTENGELTRPLQRLFPLEVSSEVDSIPITSEVKKIAKTKKTKSSESEVEPQGEVKTKSGRRIKKPVRYDDTLF